MTHRFGLLLLAVGTLFCTCVWAQNDTGTTDNTAPVQPGPKPAYIYPDASPSLDFLTPALENSSITLGISGGVAYDSTGYYANSGQNFWIFQVAPSIKIQEFRPNLSWNVSYAPGYQLYTRPGPSNNNLFSQRVSAGFLWQMARRWQLAGSDTFTHSANPFDSYLTVPGNPSMNNPNPVTYYPLTQFTQNFALLTLTNQLSKVDTISFNGTANLRQTSTYNLVTTVPFYNLVSYGGRMSYSHQFSPRLSLGAGYDYNSLDFGAGQQRSGIQTISMTGDYLIRPNMTISGWVGPSYTSTKTIVGVPILGQIVYITSHNSFWSTTAGANFQWHGRRDSVLAGFSRQVSDGGGILATVQSNVVNGSYRRQLTQKMNATASAWFLDSVSTTVSSRRFSDFAIHAGLVYQVAKSFTATVNYVHLYYTRSNTILIGNNNYNSNIVGVNLSYSWNHPLGR